MTIEKALREVETHYNYALTVPAIHDPVAWALYQVWRDADLGAMNRRRAHAKADADMD